MVFTFSILHLWSHIYTNINTNPGLSTIFKKAPSLSRRFLGLLIREILLGSLGDWKLRKLTFHKKNQNSALILSGGETPEQ